jgi:hypothetical protein
VNVVGFMLKDAVIGCWTKHGRRKTNYGTESTETLSSSVPWTYWTMNLASFR